MASAIAAANADFPAFDTNWWSILNTSPFIIRASETNFPFLARVHLATIIHPPWRYLLCNIHRKDIHRGQNPISKTLERKMRHKIKPSVT